MDNNDKYNHLGNFLFKWPSYKKNCREWKLKKHAEYDYVENLVHLRKLKIVLIELSCGIRDKTPDWTFPADYEKDYKKYGWKMFDNPEIDVIPLDWRPKLSKW